MADHRSDDKAAGPGEQGGQHEPSTGIARDMPDDLARAIAAASDAIADDAAWDRLEAIARTLQRPDEVAVLFQQVLAQPISPLLATRVGARAARFHDEWFSDLEPLTRILARVLELDPSAEWAFQRLTLTLTSTARWGELLDVYDRVIAGTAEVSRQRALLDEAADVARDFAGDDDRTVHYLRRRVELDPDDELLVASLESMLADRGRHRDIIRLWLTRVATLAPEAARALQLRVASTYADALDEPAEALSVIERILADEPAHAAALALAERIGTDAHTAVDVRRRALSQASERLIANSAWPDAERVLHAMIACTEGAERAGVHSKIAERFIATQREHEAVPHLAAVVGLQPASLAARDQLRQLAERTDAYAQYADALVGAAEITEQRDVRGALLVEAARVRNDALGETASAIALYLRYLRFDATDGAITLAVARRLLGLLDVDGHRAERLEVLEKLATVATEPVEIRDALGGVATLAEQLGETERALAAWRARLGHDPSDAEALAGMIELLDRAGRWIELIEALRRRVNGPGARESTRPKARKTKKTTASGRTESPASRIRGDLVRIARTHGDRLGDLDAAAATWTEIEKAFGVDGETEDALNAIAEARGQYDLLATRLRAALERERDAARRTAIHARLGEMYRLRLNAPDRAIEHYRQALERDVANTTAREGLRALLDANAGTPAAVHALAVAYAATDDEAATLEIVEFRVATAHTDAERAGILYQSAGIAERLTGDRAAALAMMRQAIGYEPSDARFERDLVRLSEATGDWATAMAGLREAIERSGSMRDVQVRLRMRAGIVLETALGDPPGALDEFLAVLSLRPDLRDAAAGAVRVGTALGRWSDVARGVVAIAASEPRDVPAVLASIESGAERDNPWDALTVTLEAAVRDAPDLAAETVRVIQTQIAVWHRDRRNDLDAAESVLRQVVTRNATDPDTLRLLAGLQRRAPGPALVDTLLRIADADAADLDALYEAARVAVDRFGDADRIHPILARYVAAAGERLAARGADVPAEVHDQITWAVDHRAQLLSERGAHVEAVAMFVAVSRLPLDPPRRLEFVRRAARIAAAALDDAPRAIELYRAILEAQPEDADATHQLAVLYEATGQLDQLLELRRREITVGATLMARLALRLDIARVQGVMGNGAARLDALRANLEDSPGHPATLRELGEVLERDARYSELSDVLVQQATILDGRGETELALPLWERAGALYEKRLGDVDRALECHRHVVATRPIATSIEALARLHAARNERTQEAEWLEKLIPLTPGAERPALAVRLATAYDSAGQSERAIDGLRTVLADSPAAEQVRLLLARMYRSSRAWSALIALLEDGSAHAGDPTTAAGLLRDAADVCIDRACAADRAVGLLTRAIELAPTDALLRPRLAAALRESGRFDEARALLDRLIDEYGRRRPPERAAVHFELARTAHARGDHTEALAQLDLAAGIDIVHVGVLRMLGDLARDANQLDRAERAYRMLLMIVRRYDPNRDDGTDVDSTGPAEVLFELHRIASRQDQARRAREMLESAYELAQQSTAESRRFERVLRAAGATDLLLRALRARHARATDPLAAAGVLGELAEVLAGQPGGEVEAFELRLRALANVPRSAAALEATRVLAVRLGHGERYASALDDLATQAIARGDSAAASELLLRLGEVYEDILKLSDRASDAYRRAESLGHESLPLWRSLDRIYSAQGDLAGRARVLRRIAAAHVDDAARADASYALAEILVGSPDTVHEGLDALRAALVRNTDSARAAGVLSAASRTAPDDMAVAVAYEQVARTLREPAVLLDALEHRAGLPGVSDALLREAVGLATQLERPDRAERLLRVAVERAAFDANAAWARLALAKLRHALGDLEGARSTLREAGESLRANGGAHEAILEVAQLAAGAIDDLPLAARLYEELREHSPTERTIWQPLLDVYRRIGDDDRLERAIKSAADSVFDSAERNALRLERARLLVARPDRWNEAISALRYVLGDDPTHGEVAALLKDLLHRANRTDELADLLRQQLGLAWDRVDPEAIVSLSMELAPLLLPDRRAEAIEVYRAAIESAPDRRELLQALFALYGPDDSANERADVMERLLALETGETAVQMALDLAALRESLHDLAAAARAIEVGRRVNPAEPRLVAQLERIYTELEDHVQLAALIEADAARTKDPRAAAARLREAATVRRDRLNEPAVAANVLRKAQKLAPGDLELLKDLVECLHRAGADEAAIAEVTTFMNRAATAPAIRAELLQLRSKIHAAAGRDAEALADLESAFVLARGPVAPALRAALERSRAAAAAGGDRDLEGNVTTRLADVLIQSGESETGVAMLNDWLKRAGRDRGAWRLLAATYAAGAQWKSAIDAYRKLVEVEEGAGQLAAVLKLADACEQLGEGRNAIGYLERVYRAMPQDETLRARLAKLYDSAGEHHELAKLVLTASEYARDDAERFKQLVRAGELFAMAAGDPESAIAPLERALRMRPGEPDATRLIADSLVALGRPAEASALLKSAVEQSKMRRSREIGLLQHRLARIALTAGDKRAALGWLSSAIETDMQNGPVASDLVDVAMDLGEDELALKALRAIALMKSPGPMTRAMGFLRQGMISRKQGDKRKASFYAKKALLEDPHLAEATAFLKELGD